MQPDKKSAFKKVYQSSLKASYFNHFEGGKFANQSKLQIEQIAEEEEQVDENTFRIMPGFIKPDDSFAVYEKKGLFFIEQEGFFSCITTRQTFQVQLKNFKLKVLSSSKLYEFFNFETECATVRDRNGYFELEIDSCKKRFYFQPTNFNHRVQIANDWVGLLNKIIDTSDGKKKHFNYLPEKLPDFYKQQHISNEQFEKSANSLDIVLFKSEHSAARIQRLFTDSEYDHVGVILRNKKNQLFVYESCSGDGVGLNPWKYLIKYEWYKSTDKITWRRLNIKLTPQDIDTIQGFIVKTLGKSFELNLDKLMQTQSALQRSPEEQEKKTYFCSELVARLYKELHLLPSDRASSRYYPVDFSEKISLKFERENSHFQPERVISFNIK